MEKNLTFDETLADETTLTGTVTYTCLKNSERLKYLDGSSLDMKSGKVKKEIEFSADLMELAATRIKKVDLEYDGSKINAVTQLEYYNFGMQVLTKVATELLQGPQLPKKSK